MLILPIFPRVTQSLSFPKKDRHQTVPQEKFSLGFDNSIKSRLFDLETGLHCLARQRIEVGEHLEQPQASERNNRAVLQMKLLNF